MNAIRTFRSKVMQLSILLTAITSLSMRSPYGKLTPDEELESRVLSLTSVVNIKYTDAVKDKVYHYVENHKKLSGILLGRSNMYFSLFEKVLKEKNLPEELKYLAVLESSLIPTNNSRAGASGIWQIMKPTAEILGLKVNNTIDERRDPVKSTYAAADYLQKLFNMYNDWTLALAAYNCGEGNVNKAIRKSGGSMDYWVIQKYLPGETKMYVPKFIAIKYMMNYYYLHEIVPIDVDQNLVFTATARVYEKVDLKQLAKLFDLDYDLVKQLNPAYTKNFIPKSENGDYYLTLPEAQLYSYLESRNAFDNIYFVSSETYPGDFFNPGREMNNVIALANSEPLFPESRREAERELPYLRRQRQRTKIDINKEQVNTITVKLGTGQSLADVARINGVDLASLVEENNYSDTNMPKNGDLIRIRVN